VGIAAFVIGCIAVGLSLLSLAWQVFIWRRERRFAMDIRIVVQGPGIGSQRYPIQVVATNAGGTTEWVENVELLAKYDREVNKSIRFFSPELTRNPSMDRHLPPGKRFESEFNLLSAFIGGGKLPYEVIAKAMFASGREISSEPYRPDPEWAKMAREDDPVRDLKLPEGVMDDYYPAGPHRICPDCKSEIPSDAAVCRFCGFRLSNKPKPPAI
jgi:hypothetical protein